MSDVYQGIPKSVRVGCYEFMVSVGSYEDHEMERSFGHANLLRQTISVRPGMSSQKLANTFIHEVIHAIHWVYGLMRSGEELQPTEEEYTTLTANGLCAFWQDNPQAAAWWQQLLPIQSKTPAKGEAKK